MACATDVDILPGAGLLLLLLLPPGFVPLPAGVEAWAGAGAAEGAWEAAADDGWAACSAPLTGAEAGEGGFNG